MEKYAILLGYFDKQQELIKKLLNDILNVNLNDKMSQYFFALRVQQFYTAIEDLLKQIAKAFENHIEDLATYHKGLLIRLNTDIPKIRPAVISKDSFMLLDKVRAFRHFIRHAYDCELEEDELIALQKLLRTHYLKVENDLTRFREYVEELTRV